MKNATDLMADEVKKLEQEVERLERQLTDACNLLREGRDMVEDAMYTHIYDESMGDEPDEDCTYNCFVKNVDEFLEELK